MASPSVPIMFAHIAARLRTALPSAKADAWDARLNAALGRRKDLAPVPWRFFWWLVTGSGLPDLDEPIIKEEVDACAAILCARIHLPVCREAAALAVDAVRRAAFSAALRGFSEATGYCAALAVEAVLLERSSPKAAAAKAVDAIEAAEWAAARGAEPKLYSDLAEKLIELVDDADELPLMSSFASLAADPLGHAAAHEVLPGHPLPADFDHLEAARQALLDFLSSVTGADGETVPRKLRDTIAGAADRLAEIALLLRKAETRAPDRPNPTSVAPAVTRSSPRPRGQAGTRPRAADDFAAIRARLAELQRRSL